MQQFTIRTRLLMLVGAMFIGFITIELMGFSALQRGVASLNTVYLDRVVPLRDLKTIADLYAVKIVDSSHKARSGRMTYAQAEQEVKDAGRQIDMLWHAYQKTKKIDEEQRSVDALAKLVDEAQDPIERLKGILERGDKAALDTFVENEMYPLIDPLSEGLSHLTQIQVEESKRAYDAAVVLYDSSRTMLALLLLGILICGGVFATRLIRSIIHPLTTLKDAAARVALGDLSQSIQVSGRNEVTDVQQSVQAMQANLRNTLQDIQGSAAQLAAAAEELQTATESTAQGIHRQNDEMQMAATAVTEMSAAVDEVADNANRTSNASHEAMDLADGGRKQVMLTRETIDRLSGKLNETTRTVFRLAEEASNIGRVLDVIRAIAEQTKLLALNAAIEAAHAGEAGRGFAVVADEVRNLAQRTQTSTQEIERMISAIQSVTQEGVRDVQQSCEFAARSQTMSSEADQALTLIAERITEINGMNLVIASAAEEQAQVAREVDRNLVAISDISEQSTAGVQQTSEASEELARLAANLNNLVNRFSM
ncbi:methyl-accepting chemotaxis protein (plasmid) [Pseudomonas umsongensis]|uniref:Methyl-accepting chemotaxis protein NahY n=3 Tax=Pseudomonas TaxID=286 RepID=NAHY_PSEPU|nr:MULTISPECIES: methyl-accepting chemotaxis protein [Pseudomonas]Q9Z429.1 RecName: Full=Methyl-accepting chemotaxis protein NahY [Pseudomonas putida]AAD13223.1 methyl-accepting chemotaxis protein [Pseudomonas putida]AEV45896.1 methyl-accepting chemotaxis protein NahY [Pseudomonas sp. MC1]QFG27744.1 methyl-accepting chemotaxis protein [Pseudomonas umsongensis]UPU95664.1 methyl-accepting chemotaxis protein [Pseudomonas putida]BAE92176.1 methyl-accepting chemotaxis protein NahY [Pseudomonas put